MRNYRTFDGSTFRPYNRLLPSAYQDSKQSPRSLGSKKQPLPNARNVSKIVFVSSKTNEDNTDPPSFSHMTMTWGQFLGHDILLTQRNESVSCGDNNLPCKGPQEGCIGIDILPGNELVTNRTAVCMSLRRSAIRNGEQVSLDNICEHLTSRLHAPVVLSVTVSLMLDREKRLTSGYSVSGYVVDQFISTTTTTKQSLILRLRTINLKQYLKPP